MEKCNQIKDEMQKEIEAFKIVENEYLTKHAIHTQNVRQLKSNLKIASNSYIKCRDCKSLVKIINIESHKNTMKHIISSLPKSDKKGAL